MTGYVEFLGMPIHIGYIVVGIVFVMQLIGEFLEFKGKVVPEFMKIRKFFARRKQEKQDIRKALSAFASLKESFDKFDSHYSADNIKMRDDWIKNVNNKLEENDKCMKEFGKKLDKNNKDTLDLLIENKRNIIIDFASNVVGEKPLASRDQFRRIFRLHSEYEKLLKENNMTNGETDTAIKIIEESYERHMANHTFVEDVRGYK